MKKLFKWGTILGVSATLMACGAENGDDTATDEGTDATEEADTNDTATDDSSEEQTESSDFDTSETIHVITREEGSGTRTAFTEIVGLEDEDGNDTTYQGATIQNGTSGVMQGVSSDEYAIGYISVGSIDDSIKPLQVNGVAPDPSEIASGNYEIARNFNLAYGEELTDVAQDFWDFIFSFEGQAIVEESGYVAVDSEAPAFEGGDVDGSISIVGSTSVQPVIEALSDAYGDLNENVTFEITAPGSGAGVTAAIDGTADIGMASRELDEEETSQVAEVAAIAVDGIAVIVHNDNPLEDIALDTVGSIFAGESTVWDDAQ